MLEHRGAELLGLINNRMGVVFSDVTPATEDDPLQSLAQYIYAACQTSYDYANRHAYNDIVQIDWTTLVVTPLCDQPSAWETMRAECFQVMLGLLSPDYADVLSAIAWVNHMCHLTGLSNDGYDLAKFKDSNGERLSGHMLLDHGRRYGITFELIDTVSQDSIDIVFPNALDYI